MTAAELTSIARTLSERIIDYTEDSQSFHNEQCEVAAEFIVRAFKDHVDAGERAAVEEWLRISRDQ